MSPSLVDGFFMLKVFSCHALYKLVAGVQKRSGQATLTRGECVEDENEPEPQP